MTMESLENDELNVSLNIRANKEAKADCNTKKIADRYLKKEKLGEGTYGVVFKATDTTTGQTVAVKRIRLGKYKEGVNNNALREIKLLKELKDPNIIDLIDTFTDKGNLHLVFEYMETDLEAVIRDQNIVLSPVDVKSYMHMTLKALAFCHKKWVLHRDMKPNNLLIAADGQLKLADFGLARIFGSSEHKYTHQVFARWYRAPELLFGSKQYGASVDIWAAGCIFAELLLRRPFLQGLSDIDQLGKIFAAFGTPKESQWPDMIHLPDYVEYKHIPAPSLCSLFPTASDNALDLLSKMFTYDPKSRISAEQALEHEYFSSQPPPTLPKLPEKLPKSHKKGTSDHINVSQRDGPLLLSPSRKIRRVTPGNPNIHDMVAYEHFMNTTTRVPTTGSSVDMPMSVDTDAFSYSRPRPRPTLNSADKTHLKRKLMLDPEFVYSN